MTVEKVHVARERRFGGQQGDSAVLRMAGNALRLILGHSRADQRRKRQKTGSRRRARVPEIHFEILSQSNRPKSLYPKSL